MQKQILSGAIGLIIGLIIGFIAANSINRNSQTTAIATTAEPNSAFQNQQTVVGVKDQTPPLTQGKPLPEVSEKLDKAQKEPNNFEAQVQAGDMYSRIKGFERAAEFYEKAHQIKPDDYETIVKLGNTYFDSGKFEQAEKWYQQALAKKADDVNVRTDLGITFVERANPDLDRAVNEFQISLETNPKHEPTLYNLGIAYFKKGNTEETNKILAQLETINPNGQLAERLRQITATK